MIHTRDLLVFFSSALVALLLSSCLEKKENATLFKKLASEISGVQFENTLHPTEELNIITYLYYYNGGGIAVGDVNGDSLPDIYFTANQGADALFINEGGLRFRENTKQAGLSQKNDWSSGATFTDIDQDGDLDLYVCKVSGHSGLEGRNELYINDGKGSFSESAKAFGLDISGLCTQAAFFDADGDGDLDCYLLSHSVHDTERSADARERSNFNLLAGDKLFLQEDNHFVDFTASSNLYSSRLGYGLGIAVADFTKDGRSDIYVANDFDEHDYCYQNLGGGRFEEITAQAFQHTSQFSMGCAVADVNQDGELDILTLDMRPWSDSIRKSSAGGDDPKNFSRRISRGFLNQHARNALHLGGKNGFSEAAVLAGLHSTDWSWAPVLFDADLDGYTDVFVGNGIVQRPNDLDYLKFSSAAAIQARATNLELAGLMPPGYMPNRAFKGSSNLQFTEVAKPWGLDDVGSTTAAVAVDLDNDGDLDIITNNVNSPAAIFENTAATPTSKAAKLSIFRADKKGLCIGATAFITQGKWKSAIAIQPVTGFQSSVVAPPLFSLPNPTEPYEIFILWPNGSTSTIDTALGDYTATEPLQRRLDTLTVATFNNKLKRPKEWDFQPFDSEPLYPFATTLQTDVALKEAVDSRDFHPLNQNRLGGASLSLYNTTFEDVHALAPLMLNESISELPREFKRENLPFNYLVAQGKSGRPETFRLSSIMLGTDGKVYKGELPDELQDIDDLIQEISWIENSTGVGRFLVLLPKESKFGLAKIPEVKVFYQENSSAKLLPIQLPQDGRFGYQPALVVCADNSWLISGAWAPVVKLELTNSSTGEIAFNTRDIAPSGLWQGLYPVTQPDLSSGRFVVLSNVGQNTLLTENSGEKLELHLADFDRNGKVDPIVVRVSDHQRRTLFGLDEIAKQMPPIRKFFTSYLPFSASTFDDMFPPAMSSGKQILYANELRNLLFDTSTGNTYALPVDAQLGSISKMDFNESGDIEVEFQNPTYHPQVGPASSIGVLIPKESLTSQLVQQH